MKYFQEMFVLIEFRNYLTSCFPKYQRRVCMHVFVCACMGMCKATILLVDLYHSKM